MSRHPARTIATLAMATALLFVVQVALAVVANVELVTLLLILYTLHFRRKTLLVIYGFAFLEGLFYGFHLWWVMYLYVWTILWAVVLLLSPAVRSRLYWALIAGVYGLSFGFLCAIPYLALGGPQVMLSWWVAGIPYDLIHGCANFLLVFFLFTPLDNLFTRWFAHHPLS